MSLATATKKKAAASEAAAPGAVPLVGTLTIPRSALVEALTPLAAVIARRTTLPVLETVLFEVLAADGDGIRVTATDLDQVVRVRLAAGVSGGAAEHAGLRAAIPGRQLLDVAKAMPAGDVIVLRLEPGKVTVVGGAGGRTKFVIPTMDPAEFPQVPSSDMPVIATLPAGQLAAAMSRVEFAASREQSRPTINSVLLEGAADGLWVLAIDGHRLARTRLLPAAPFTGAYIVPIGAVPHLTRLFADDELVTIHASTQRLLVASATRSIEMRLLEGPYPFYRHLPERFVPALTVALDRVVFLAALRRAALALEGHHVLVELTIPAAGPDGDQVMTEVQLRSESDRAGRAEDAVPCRIVVGSIAPDAPFRIGFNVHYLVSALGFFTDDEITVGFSKRGEPGWLSTIDEAAAPPNTRAAWVVVMPLALRD